MGRRIDIEPGTPLAAAVTRAGAAFARADAEGCDAAYGAALELVGDDAGLWSALAADHVARLLELGRPTLAAQRCGAHLRVAGGALPSLRLLRAEIHSSIGDHAGVAADAAALRAVLGTDPDALEPDERAKLHRLEGLAAADQDDVEGALRSLYEARRMLAAAGDPAGVAAIGRDVLAIAVRYGHAGAVSAALSVASPRTVADHLLLAMALKRQLRYEEAFRVLLTVPDRDRDPALSFHILHESIVLLRLMRDDGVADLLLPLLRHAAAASPGPVTGGAAVARLSGSAPPATNESPGGGLGRKLQHAQRLIADERFDAAEYLLVELRPALRTDRDISTWHLAAGELGLAKGEPLAAARHLGEAAEHATATALGEARVAALRLLGRANARLRQDDLAAECWARAHRIEERIAGRQVSDETRIRMLQAVADEHDERIRAAAAEMRADHLEPAAAVVVAMEAARGAAILGRILPARAGLERNLPKPSDLPGAWNWVAKTANGLPESQVAWLLHSAPDRIHHAVIGRGLLRHFSVTCGRKELEQAVDALMACWDQRFIEDSIAEGEFDRCLQELAARIGIAVVLPDLPPQVRRIAIVAGGRLSDVPFGALPLPGGAGPAGLRFALSDLPCLSARQPLRQRSVRLRGDTPLLVSPQPGKLTSAAVLRGRTVLAGHQATPANLQAMLELHRHRQVRIDSHGQYEHPDSVRSWLQLAPDGLDGRLTAEDLKWMDLRGCGTLVLGACESGMAQRTGRDERTGFVRAAFHAGVASVVAAKWVAVDEVAAPVLDGFDRYVRYLPRDLALQRAQLDVCTGARGVPADLPAIDHPARWACWTLYGDPGRQTNAGPVRRLLRKNVTQRRPYAVLR
jgi:hypothetical protein